jgi:multidrug resistance protein, MATE family
MHFIQYNTIVIISITTNITYITNYFLLTYYSNSMNESTWYLSVFHQAFTGWREYLTLAVPSMFIICSEWWMFEVLVVFAGWIGVVYIATLIIIFNIHNLLYDISYGLSQAASSQIGRTLAEMGRDSAKDLLKFISLIQIFLMILFSAVLYFGCRSIICLYTDDEAMIDLFESCKYLLILMFNVDSLLIVLGGVIRGIGEQGESSVISFISYGLITLPLTILYSFYYDLKLHGILIAYVSGMLFSLSSNLIVLLKSKWELSIDTGCNKEDEKDETIK